MLDKKKAQEEMFGFALIIVIVAVLFLVFISFSLKEDREAFESYEIDSFIQSSLEYTTDCVEGYVPRYYLVRRLITACDEKRKCLDERDTCDVLKKVLSEITKESWKVGKESPIKGYELAIDSDKKSILNVSEGNTTNNYKSSMQALGREKIEVSFTAYY